TMIENTSTVNVQFDPIAAGTTTLALATPSGFETPTATQQITATVNAPDISMSGGSIGEDMQESRSISLGVAPPAPVDIALNVVDGSIARISESPTAVGSTSITFPGVANASGRTYYLQGLKQGTTQITASAPGFNSNTQTITVTQSGFIIYSPGNF